MVKGAVIKNGQTTSELVFKNIREWEHFVLDHALLGADKRGVVRQSNDFFVTLGKDTYHFECNLVDNTKEVFQVLFRAVEKADVVKPQSEVFSSLTEAEKWVKTHSVKNSLTIKSKGGDFCDSDYGWEDYRAEDVSGDSYLYFLTKTELKWS